MRLIQRALGCGVVPAPKTIAEFDIVRNARLYDSEVQRCLLVRVVIYSIEMAGFEVLVEFVIRWEGVVTVKACVCGTLQISP